MNQRLAIESLAMDLKRISLGIQRGSTGMARRFKEEALKREEELSSEDLDLYLKSLVQKTRSALDDEDPESLLMYSTLLQNVAVSRYQSDS